MRYFNISGLSSGFVVAENEDKTNDCPTDAYVLSEEECKSVPEKITKRSYESTVDDQDGPVGCYRNEEKVHYNKATRGNARSGNYPICGNCKFIII